MIALSNVADEYNDEEHHTDAAQLLDRALAIYKGAAAINQPTRPTKRCFIIQKAAFSDAGDMLGCINTCRRFLEFLDALPLSQKDEENMRHRRETYTLMGRCLARLDRPDEAREAFRHAEEDVHLLDFRKHKANMKDLPDLAFDLLLIGEYERSASTIRKTLEPDNILHDDENLPDAYLAQLQPLVDSLEQMGVFDFDYRRFLRGAMLLEAAGIQTSHEFSVDANWWRNTECYLQNPSIFAIDSKRVFLGLKKTDEVLSVSNWAESTSHHFRYMAASLSEMGNDPGAALLSAHAASRYFIAPSEPFWQGLVLVADAALFRRKFELVLLVLRSAWDAYRCKYSIDCYLMCCFVDEYVNDSEYIIRTENAGDNTSEIGIRQAFLSQACALLAQAGELSANMDRPENRIQTDNREEDDREAAVDLQIRESHLARVESRLVDLGAERLLVAANNEARAATVQSETRKIRRVRSFADSVASESRVLCWRRISRSRSWESLRGVPDKVDHGSSCLFFE
jgi:hypothetical protein